MTPQTEPSNPVVLYKRAIRFLAEDRRLAVAAQAETVAYIFENVLGKTTAEVMADITEARG